MIERLNEADCRDRAAQLKAWSLDEAATRIRRTFVFANFVEAFGFMTSVALMAERADHHPEWRNVYNRVEIELTTHTVKGLSVRDFALAAEIDALAP